MFCYNCGQQLPDVARFCMKCGTATLPDVSTENLEVPPRQAPENVTRAVTLHTSTGQDLQPQVYEGEVISEGQLMSYSQESQAKQKTEARGIPLDEQIRDLLAESICKFGGIGCKEDIREALRLCNQALALDNNNSEIYLQKGFLLAQTQRYKDALDAYEQAIKLGNPPTADHDVKAEALHGKGSTLMNLERYEEALTALNEAISLNPNSSRNYTTKSFVLWRLGHTEEAKELEAKGKAMFQAEREEHERFVEEYRRRATQS